MSERRAGEVDEQKIRHERAQPRQGASARPEKTLQAAAQDGDCSQWAEYVRRLSQDERTKLLNGRDEDGNSALHYLARKNNSDMVEELIGLGADVNVEDANKKTPLHLAAELRLDGMVSILLKNHADVRAKDSDGRTPLLVAAFCGCNVFDSLIREGASLEETDGDNSTVVHLAVESGNPTVLRKVLKKADKKGCLDSVCSTKRKASSDLPLHMAVTRSNVEAVTLLLESVEDAREHVCTRNSSGRAPSHIAAEKDLDNILQLLIECDSSCISCEDTDCNTPLHLACAKGCTQVVERLLKHERGKKSLNTRNAQDQTPLHLAVDQDQDSLPDGCLAVLDMLLKQAGIDKDAQDSQGMTALHIACQRGHIKVVQKLLEADCDVRKTDMNQHNPLDLAIKMEHEDIAMAIIGGRKWKEALMNKSGHATVKTPLRRLIKSMPDIVKVVLTQCTTPEGKPGSKDYKISFDYQFVEDFRERQFHSHPSLHSGRYEMGQDSGDWRPIGFSKMNHPLKLMVENKRIDLLKHPLVTSLLNDKWDQFGGYLYFFNLVMFALFVIFLTSFALTVLNPQTDVCRAVFNGTFGVVNSSLPTANFTDIQRGKCGLSGNMLRSIYATAILTLIFAVIRLVAELGQLAQLKQDYFLDWVNYVEVPLFIFSIIFCSVFATDCLCPRNFQWQIGIIAVLLGWLNLVFFIRNLPRIGIYVGMLLHICKTFLKMAVLAFLLVVGFSIAFYMAFFDPKFRRTPFSTPGRSIIALIADTAGGPDVGPFQLSFGGSEGVDEIAFVTVSYVMWVVFVIVMPILLINMLIGLAVDDIKGIKDAATFRRIALKVELVLTIEESFVFRTFLASRIKRKVEFAPFKREHYVVRVLKAVKYFFWGDHLAGSIKEFHRRREDPVQIQLQELKEKLEKLALNQRPDTSLVSVSSM